MRRTVVLGSVVSVVFGSVAVGAAPAIAKPVTPKVSSISSPAGPLSARALTLRGQNLQLVKKVRFGSSAATQVRHHGSRSLTLRAPASKRAVTVRVAVFSGGRWRNTVKYAYLARPVVTGLSAGSGPLSGGGTITIRGRGLSSGPKVRFGPTAARIVATAASSLRVVVPVGLEGPVGVTVVTPGGTSAASSAASFSYVRPAAVDTSTFTPVPGAVTGTGIQWVSGGTDADDPASTSTDRWLVSVAAGGAIPQVGDPYFVAPGGDVFPSGLAGTTESIAAQQDGSTRLTIAPSALDEVLDDSTIRFADGPDRDPAPAGRRRAASASESTAAQASFTGLGPNVFNCKRKSDGAATTFAGEIGMRFERMNRSFYMTQGRHPAIDGWITGSLVTYGKVSVTGSITCDLRPSWSNANRRTFPLGGGATLSFGPTAELEISGSGDVSFEQTTAFMYGLSKYDDRPVEYYRIARQSGATSTGSASLGVKVSAGLSMQIGILDRVGIEIKAQVYAEGTLSAKTGPIRVCADLDLGLKLSVGAFLDLWVVRWEATALELKFEFSALHVCSAKDEPAAPTTNPQITSDDLPDASVGDSYSTQLTTADDRLGHWTLIGGALPPGLSLGDDGSVAGTPTSGVGTARPVVRFSDESGRHTDAALRLRVLPGSGLGGGDIQATLTWGSSADLDLHAVEPSGNEIYYSNPGPTDTGGDLDHDANAGCGEVDPAPAENVHWPSRSAASGAYYFTVVTYDDCGTSELDWHLVVRVQGRVVLDRSGYGTSDTYELDYGTNGQLRVRTRPVDAPPVSRTPK